MSIRQGITGTLCALLLAGCATPGGRPDSGGGLAEWERILRLQIFLDERNHGPGKIDGEWGYFTETSRRRWLSDRGLPFDNDWEARMGLATAVPRLTRPFTIPATASRFIGPVAPDVEGQSKQKSMPYTSYAEYVAERFHTTRPFLAKLNPGLPLDSLAPGSTLTVPSVTEFRIESIRHAGNVPAPAAAAGRRVHVDTTTRYLEVMGADGRLVAMFPITPGSPAHPAPPGDWRIVGTATMPWFRYDEGVLKRGERTEEYFMIPAGPNNPVGVLWMGLSKPGIGIHGTNDPFTIGRAGSHGCIRLSNWNAAKMPALVGKGTPVRID